MTVTALPSSPYVAGVPASATVTIADVNRKPNVDDKSLYIPINHTGIIYNVGATDPDIGQTLTYQLYDTANPTSAIPFSIDSSGNISKTGTPTDPQYALTVRVTDNGSPNKDDTGAITINVYSFNAAPRTLDYLQNRNPSRPGDE